MKYSFKIIKINGVRLKVPLNDVEEEYIEGETKEHHDVEVEVYHTEM